jgi:hypothetical protein
MDLITRQCQATPEGQGALAVPAAGQCGSHFAVAVVGRRAAARAGINYYRYSVRTNLVPTTESLASFSSSVRAHMQT